MLCPRKHNSAIFHVSFLSLFSTECIAECIMQKLPFASVTAAISEDENEVNLATVTPSIKFLRE